jgi:hypothetical protein
MQILDAARTGKLPLTAVGVLEPVGLRPMSVSQGRREYYYYQRGPEKQRRAAEKPSDKEMAKADQQTLLARMVAYGGSVRAMGQLSRRQLTDVRHYQRLWATPTSRDNALYLAQQPDLTFMCFFAEDPLADTPGAIDAFAREVYNQRPHEAHAAPLIVERIAGTTHGSFDDPQLYSGILKSLLGRLREYQTSA